jgi:RNA polymerase sigma-70 factor (ECF subfamily)
VRAATVPEPDLARQRQVVDAFVAAAREGDFEALLAVLDPQVLLRADSGVGASRVVSGAASVARQALAFAGRREHRPVLVNGTAGVLVGAHGRPLAVLGFTITGGKIVEIDILADTARLRGLDLPMS